MPYHTILRNAVQVANSNWHNSATSFSPTITWEDEDGRQATIGYSDRQVVTNDLADAVGTAKLQQAGK
jgi:hypothetical protein